jgi:hypothetical protein
MHSSDHISKIINNLLNSSEPSIRFKTLVNVVGEDPSSSKMKKIQEEIRNSPRVKTLLSSRNSKGEIISKRNVYDKWQGAHWVMASLAYIGYPPEDESLTPVKEQVLNFWLDEFYYKEFEVAKQTDCYKHEGVPLMQGRYRRCASQQGNALYFLLKLGLDDERIDDLVERLLHWQWNDGGWNCDKNPDAKNSSFMESLLPLRGLALYHELKKDKKVKKAVAKASEIFLKRQLFLGQRSGEIIHPEFILLHYPLYWHYDILGSLKVMAEAGFINDNRCSKALDLLESKSLDEGWPAEKSYYRVSEEIRLGTDYVDWGGTSRKKSNEWITVDALYVLKKSGRV